MPEFHHPYNFIPATGKVNNQTTPKISYEEIAAGYKGVRHDLWEKDTQSGRIVARVHLVTPTMVGGQQTPSVDPNGAALVESFKRDGKIALPANSLRGVIGSVAETLSQSSLRVLEKRRYSVRKPVEHGLSAIGMLRENKNDPSQFEILPLTVPHHLNDHLSKHWLNIFGGTTPLKYRIVAPVLGYQKANEKTDALLGFIPDSYLDKHPSLQSFHDVDHQEYFYAKLMKSDKETLLTECKKLLLDQPLSEILTADEYKKAYKKIHSSELKNYVRGFLRVLGIEGREESMPKTKKREFFIPYPSNTAVKPPKALPIPTAVIENFRTLAQERHAENENLPFLPKGYDSWQPKSGQLVFFDICENAEGRIEVSEISFSSIWRKLIKGESHEFFSQIDPDLLPWNPLRDSLTPAECLFGVVEDGKNEEAKQARALASRVRFYDAVSTKQVKPENQVEPELVTLKILSSPKPPSPAMYFHPSDPKQARHIKKTDLTLEKHRPNGRKVYLHHAATDIQKKPWITANGDNLQQKVRCQPIAAGENFYFHVDFDNLSKAELNLLIHSLYPSEVFQHRLGLGKTLGLGSVKIDIMGVFLIHRTERYSLKGFYETARYHQALRGMAESTEWEVLYPTEFDALKTATELKSSDFYTDKSLIDDTSLNLLNTVGNPAKLKEWISVKPPLTNQQVSEEEETFQWFGVNERAENPQALGLIKAGEKLPTLRTN